MKRELITNKLKAPNTSLEVLKKNFSDCFDKTGKFDFEKFKKELETKQEIDFSNESYGMDWLGKSYARLLAVDEAKTLLKENKDWNQRPENKNSENLLIKGDNLEVLKHLSNSYREKIKIIYIDPPYNTGSDGFVYQDDRKFSVEELSELAGIEQDKAKRILDFTKSKSNSHSAWLTFMYPRLYIAKQLLRDDGVIFISIDDNEVAQLRLLMDEIFGEENFVEIFSWTKTSTPPTLSNKSRKTNEYILCYEKNKNSYRYFGENLDGGDQPLGNEGNNVGILEIPKEKIKFLTKDGKYDAGLYHRIKLLDTINIKNGESDKNIRVEGRFKWQQSFLNNEVKKGTTFVVKSGKFSIRFLRIYDESHKTPTNYIKDKIINPLLDRENCNVDTNETSSKQLEELFGVRVFEFPKPVSLIKYLINFIPESDIILDFFAGSGTTGDAVMQLNVEDGGNRKFILVQLPEPIDPKKNKTAYDFVKNELVVVEPTIFDITKERLIRAGKKSYQSLVVSSKLKNQQLETKNQQIETNLDFGFRIFETTPIWEDYNLDIDEFDSQLKLFNEDKLTEEDLQTLLITWKTYDGFSLTQDLEKLELDGYPAYYLNKKLYLVNKGFKTKNLKALIEKIDSDQDFEPTTIISFGYNFESKVLREISENIKNYINKKNIDIDFIVRY